MDNLTYTYDGNKLNQVTDGISATDNEVDFIPRGSGNYTYYTDGSLKSDENETISLIIYDTYLKQPKEIQITDGRKINHYYDGAGALLKTVYSTGEVWEYAGIISKNGQPFQMPAPEGRAIYQSSSWQYEFFYTDHLGNTRTAFRANGNQLLKSSETAFDPWGVVLRGAGQANGISNRFEYQNKEKESTFGLNRINLGARTYNPTIGRMDRVDVLSDMMRRHSTYAVNFNNPLRFIDPDGNRVIWSDGYSTIEQPEQSGQSDGDYFDRNGEFLGTDGNLDGKVYVLNAGERARTENKNINWGGTFIDPTGIRSKSTEIDMESDLGYLIRAVYGEAGGKTEYTSGKVISEEAKLGVAEVIRNRANDTEPNSSSYGYSRYFSSYEGYKDIVKNTGFDATKLSKFKSPKDYISNQDDKETALSEFRKSVSTSLRAHYQNTNVTNGALYFITPVRASVPSSWRNVEKVNVKGVDEINEFTFYKFSTVKK